MTGTRLRVAFFAELDGGTLYALLRLRVDVFVVEQACAYPELDGRDLEPGTRHAWLTTADRGSDRDGDKGRGDTDHGGSAQPLAYLRILEEPDGTARIGRVCVAPSARRAGHAANLLDSALAVIGERPAVLHAQSHATSVYERAGFVVDGPEFEEDGIPHVPMRRPAPPRAAS